MDYLHPDDLPLASAVRAQIGSGEAARGVVARIRLADGTYRYMSLTSHPVLDESGAVVGAVGGMKDVDDLVRARMQVEHERTLCGPAATACSTPRSCSRRCATQSGQVVDFTYVALNRAACEYLHRPAEELLGTRLLATLPGLSASGPVRPYVEVVEIGQAVPDHRSPVRQRAARRGALLRRPRVRAGPDLLSLTWSDVTERLQVERVVEASEEKYRLLAENVSDVVVHVRDGLVAWVSPSVEPVFGAPPAGVGGSAHGGVHPSGRPRAGAARHHDPDARCHRHGPAADPGSRRHLPLGRVELPRVRRRRRCRGRVPHLAPGRRCPRGVRGRTRPPCADRRGHRPAEPGRGPAAPGRPHGPGTTAWRPRRRAVLRRRLVQERQRQVRARDGRRGAPRHGRADQRDDPQGRCRRPIRWRRVPRRTDRHPRSRGGPARRGEGAAGVPRGDRRAGGGRPGHGEHRRRLRERGGAGGRGDRRRGPGDVPGQADRPRPRRGSER